MLTKEADIERIERDLTTDPNLTYNEIENEIQLQIKKHLPVKKVKFNKYKHKKLLG